MAIQEGTEPNKLAARRLVEPLLDRAGVKHRELAEALFLSPGALARKLGVRYPDRFSERELDALAAFLDLTAAQRGQLLRCYGLASGEAVPSSEFRVPSRSASLGTRNSELGTSLTSFVGREWELATVRRLLATTRLLTLTGAGGVGKTRLAIEVARLSAPLHRDGVGVAELTLTDGAALSGAVAAALSVRTAPGSSPLEALVDALHEREFLLFMDNCEQVVEDCAVLVETLLGRCPSLTVLATSREPLGVAGETLWHVPSLTLPPAPHEEPDAAIDAVASVRLFCDRAAAVRPDFALTDANAAAVARICRRLDGIPLAIELAAAQLAYLTLGDLAARLDCALDLLVGGPRAAHPRQRTLRATLDWSYELLDGPERSLFADLGAFAGSFDLAGVQAVAERGEAGSVAPLLGALVLKSLVQADTRAETARYRLLEPVRAYASEQLAAGNGHLAARARHRAWAWALVDEARSALRGPDGPAWLARLDLEHDNLRAALASSLEDGDPETGVRITSGLVYYWEMHGHVAEGRRWAERLLAQERPLPPARRMDLLRAAGNLTRDAGDYDRATVLIEENLALARALDEPLVVAGALNNLAGCHWNRGDFDAARPLWQESLSIFRRLDRTLDTAQILTNLGMLASTVGDPAGARPYLEESLARFRSLGDRWAEARVLLALGAAADFAGDPIAASGPAAESLALYRELGDRRGEAWALSRLASIAVHRGDDTAAERLYEESLHLARRMDDRRHVSQTLHGLADLALRRGDPAGARPYLDESLALHRELHQRWGIAESLEIFAAAAVQEGRTNEAARLAGAADALRESLGYARPPVNRAIHDRLLADLRASLGETVFRQAYEGGRSLSEAEAIDEALRELAPTPGPSPAARRRGA